MRTHKPSRFVTFVSVFAMLVAFLAPAPASAQAITANICLAVDLNQDGNVTQVEVDAAVSAGTLNSIVDAALILLLLAPNACSAHIPATTGSSAGTTGSTSSTVGVTSGSTTGSTVGVTSGATTGSTVGVTSGVTTGSTVGVTSGSTTGSTAGVTSGVTSSGTVGVTSGTTAGSTTGATTGSTAGATSGSTAGTAGSTSGTAGTTAGTAGSTAGTAGTTAGTAGSTGGSAVAQVTGLPSTGSGETMSAYTWPLIAAGSVLILLAGHFVVSSVKQRGK